ncbi:MAG: hypothetical protein HYR51_08470 [Candidatus Rokubacteria bacterium]|nr:hypothetical protein [Candidatus Rokubacteria bacterium]
MYANFRGERRAPLVRSSSLFGADSRRRTSFTPHLDQGEYLTRLGHALQDVHAAIDEREARTADEVAHCARNEYLAR